jgi:predicted transcriptional regulator
MQSGEHFRSGVDNNSGLQLLPKEKRMDKPKSGAVTKVRACLNGEPLTHSDLRERCPDLSDGQISMSLAHLRKKGLIEQEKIARVKGFGRKEISTYRLKTEERANAQT